MFKHHDFVVRDGTNFIPVAELEEAKRQADAVDGAVYERLMFDGETEPYIADLIYPKAPEPAFGYDALIKLNSIIVNYMATAMKAERRK